MSDEKRDPTARSTSMRTVLVRLAFETDASDLDFAQAADALEAKLCERGAKVGRGWLATDYPDEAAAREFWVTVEADPKAVNADVLSATANDTRLMPEVCPSCGGKNHVREFTWWKEHFESIAKRVKRSGKGTIAERRLLGASVDLRIVQQHLGTLCGSREGQAAKDRLAAAVRELMAKGEKPS